MSENITCTECGSNRTTVLATRPDDIYNICKRKRRCRDCQHEFSTTEKPDDIQEVSRQMEIIKIYEIFTDELRQYLTYRYKLYSRDQNKNWLEDAVSRLIGELRKII